MQNTGQNVSGRCQKFGSKKEWINELNVFPVPDGDTGTNMTMTIMSAASEVSSLEEFDMETLAKAISSGSLRGARGNSGVILSQLLRGFTKSVKKQRVWMPWPLPQPWNGQWRQHTRLL